MLNPEHIKKGDKVVIVSTARKITQNEVAPSIEILERWGLNVVLGKNLYAINNQFAGTQEERIHDFQQALDDDSIKAIICARGGYGTIQIIDQLNFSKFNQNPKWIAGYSDITVLHSHLHSQLGVSTLHGTMPINFKSNTQQALDSYKKALFGSEYRFDLSQNELNRKGSAEGLLVGGNLSILHNLIGTNSDINTDGKILFLEDLDEYLYHIERMMFALKKSDKLKSLSGLIVGGMTDMNDNTVPFGKTAKEIISDTVSEYDYPVCFDFPAGHIDDNRALILGKKIRLTVEEVVSLKYLN